MSIKNKKPNSHVNHQSFQNGENKERQKKEDGKKETEIQRAMCFGYNFRILVSMQVSRILAKYVQILEKTQV